MSAWDGRPRSEKSRLGGLPWTAGPREPRNPRRATPWVPWARGGLARRPMSHSVASGSPPSRPAACRGAGPRDGAGALGFGRVGAAPATATRSLCPREASEGQGPAASAWEWGSCPALGLCGAVGLDGRIPRAWQQFKQVIRSRAANSFCLMGHPPTPLSFPSTSGVGALGPSTLHIPSREVCASDRHHGASSGPEVVFLPCSGYVFSVDMMLWNQDCARPLFSFSEAGSHSPGCTDGSRALHI